MSNTHRMSNITTKCVQFRKTYNSANTFFTLIQSILQLKPTLNGKTIQTFSCFDYTFSIYKLI